MSSLGVHLVQGGLATAVLYPLVGTDALWCGASVVLIDLDHVVEYMRQTRCWNPFGVFACSSVIEHNLDKGFLVLNVAHTVEWFLLVSLFACWIPVLWWVVGGGLFHLALDFVHLRRHRNLRARAVSIIEYLLRIRSGRYITRVSELLRQADLRLPDPDGLCRWARQWGMQVGGDEPTRCSG